MSIWSFQSGIVRFNKAIPKVNSGSPKNPTPMVNPTALMIEWLDVKGNTKQMKPKMPERRNRGVTRRNGGVGDKRLSIASARSRLN